MLLFRVLPVGSNISESSGSGNFVNFAVIEGSDE